MANNLILNVVEDGKFSFKVNRMAAKTIKASLQDSCNAQETWSISQVHVPILKRLKIGKHDVVHLYIPS